MKKFVKVINIQSTSNIIRIFEGLSIFADGLNFSCEKICEIHEN